MDHQKGLGPQKSRTERQHTTETEKSHTSHRLEGQISVHRQKSQMSHSRVEPERVTPAGPMAATSQRNARKSFAVTGTILIPRQVDRTPSQHQHKENTTVHTSTPAVETRSQRSEHQGPNYSGDVNLLSIM